VAPLNNFSFGPKFFLQTKETMNNNNVKEEEEEEETLQRGGVGYFESTQGSSGRRSVSIRPSCMSFVALTLLVLMASLTSSSGTDASHRMNDEGVCTTNHNCIEKCADDQINTDIMTWLGSNEPRLAQFQGNVLS